MKLYHFTALEYIESILANGLTKGEVVITPRDIRNGVNLTSDPDPAGHGLTDGGRLTTRERRFMSAEAGAYWPNKRRLRIAVEIADQDAGLQNWLQWSKINVDPETRQALIRFGGGIIKASTWYVHFDTILPCSFTEIGVRDHSGNYVACRSSDELHAAISSLQLPGVRIVASGKS